MNIKYFLIAARLGRGVYFALNAKYSAQNTYAPPDAYGFQRIYYSRVLTGQYTLGAQDMIVPPLRDAQQEILYDSVVENVDRPIIFVTFHDSQAYPSYLITFKRV